MKKLKIVGPWTLPRIPPALIFWGQHDRPSNSTTIFLEKYNCNSSTVFPSTLIDFSRALDTLGFQFDLGFVKLHLVKCCLVVQGHSLISSLELNVVIYIWTEVGGKRSQWNASMGSGMPDTVRGMPCAFIDFPALLAMVWWGIFQSTKWKITAMLKFHRAALMSSFDHIIGKILQNMLCWISTAFSAPLNLCTIPHKSPIRTSKASIIFLMRIIKSMAGVNKLTSRFMQI